MLYSMRGQLSDQTGWLVAIVTRWRFPCTAKAPVGEREVTANTSWMTEGRPNDADGHMYFDNDRAPGRRSLINLAISNLGLMTGYNPDGCKEESN